MNATSTRPQLGIIVPAFNESKALGGVVEALLTARGDQPWEILVVDDGSTDGTSDALRPYADKIRILRHASNRGYGASLKTGIIATRARDVLFFDADGQHDAADIPAFVEALKSHECVFGVRPPGAGIPVARRPGKWLLHRLCEFLANRRIPDINCGFRAGRRRLYMRMLDLLPDGFSFSMTSLLYVLKSRFSFVFIPIRAHHRLGTSSVRIVRDGLRTSFLALRLIMLFDPLRALGYPAILLILIGASYQTYILYATRLRIVGGAILTILSGMMLFLFALLGDQVASLRKELSSHYSLLLEDSEEEDGA